MPRHPLPFAAPLRANRRARAQRPCAVRLAPRACRTTASAYPGPIVPHLNCRIALVVNAPLPKSHAKPTGRGTQYWERASPKSHGRAGQMLQGAVDQIPHALFVSPIIWACSGVCYRRGFPKRVKGYELAPACRVSARIERDLINPSGEMDQFGYDVLLTRYLPPSEHIASNYRVVNPANASRLVPLESP